MNDNFPLRLELPTSQEFRDVGNHLIELMFQALEERDFDRFDQLKPIADFLERAAKARDLH